MGGTFTDGFGKAVFTKLFTALDTALPTSAGALGVAALTDLTGFSTDLAAAFNTDLTADFAAD